MQRSIEVVRSATGPDDAILVGLAAHRHTLMNPIVAYYLADRRPGSRWTMYNPGVTNTDATQAAMVTDLEVTRTNVMILDVAVANEFEYSNDSRLAGSTILDVYIAAHFRTWCDFGAVLVAVRSTWESDSLCPLPIGS